jgi:hypothetical protein
MFVAAMLSFAPWIRGGQLPSEPSHTVATLEPGKAIERAMAGGETDDFKVYLKAGQFLHMVVDQRGIDLVVRTLSSDGKRIVVVGGPTGDHGPEPAQVVAAASGDYQLEIRPLEKTANRGGYQVNIVELLTADQYAERLAAQKAGPIRYDHGERPKRPGAHHISQMLVYYMLPLYCFSINLSVYTL